jgi:hypothetical protein
VSRSPRAHASDSAFLGLGLAPGARAATRRSSALTLDLLPTISARNMPARRCWGARGCAGVGHWCRERQRNGTPVSLDGTTGHPHHHDLLMPPTLVDESQASQILCGPVGLVFNHASEGFGRKRIPWPMKRHRHATSVGVAVVLMAPSLGAEGESITDQGADEFPRREGSQC